MARDPAAAAILGTLVLLLLGFPDLFVDSVKRVWNGLQRRINRGTFSLILIVFIWGCVFYAKALPVDDIQALSGEYHDTWVRSHLDWAELRTTESFDFRSPDELVGLTDEGHGGPVCIWDSGARRSVILNRADGIPGSERPCPFRIKGIHSTSAQPECLIDYFKGLPLDDGSVLKVRVRDAVVLPSAPHEVLSPGRLEKEGVCSWDGRVPGGKRVVLFNHGFIVLPHCRANDTSHSFTVQSVHAAFEVNGSEAQSSTETQSAPAQKSPAVPPARGLLHWFSGRASRPNSLVKMWSADGSLAVGRDSVDGVDGNLLREDVVAADLASIDDKSVNRLMAGFPCNTHTVSRFRPHKTLRPLRDINYPKGRPGLQPHENALVRGHNLLLDRMETAVLRVHHAGGLFIIENPVQRNDPSGPWKRFNSGKFPLHCSLWQMQQVRNIASETKARVVHVPLCWFAHCRDPICPCPQKYISLMFSREMSPALGFLADTRCVHEGHDETAVGFDAVTGASRGAATATYPDEMHRIVVRALRDPTRCASDEANGWPDGEVYTGHEELLPKADGEVVDAQMPVVDGAKGLSGDKHPSSSGLVVVSGHKASVKRLTSPIVHDSFLHLPAERLRAMVHTCRDVPPEWAQLLDSSHTCADCLAGKSTHLSSLHHLPECTEPGEIIAMDLWSTRTPDKFTGSKLVYGAIDLCSDYDFIIKIESKTQVPQCIERVLRVSESMKVRVRRLHCDNESIFLTPEALEATKTKLAGMGVLLTTGCEYDSKQNSKIERHWRWLNDTARPGFLQSQLGDEFYICAIVDASAKHKVLPLPRAELAQSPLSLFCGEKGRALPHKPFGALAYVQLEHELNNTRVRLEKSHARSEPGILLSYGTDGTLNDRFRPGWHVWVPHYHMNRPIATPHCSIVLGCYPGQSAAISGQSLQAYLRQRVAPAMHSVVTLRSSDDGSVVEDPSSLLPSDANDAPLLEEPEPSEGGTESPIVQAQRVEHISQRLPSRSKGYAGSSNWRTPGNYVVDDEEIYVVNDTYSHGIGHAVLPVSSFHSASYGTSVEPDTEPDPAQPDLEKAPWLSSPRGVEHNESVAFSDVDGSPQDQIVLMATEESGLNLLRPVVQTRAPERTVRFLWGDVPYPWADGWCTPFETGIDGSVFSMEEVLASVEADDDPRWEQAVKGNERTKWEDAAHVEYDNLERFGIINLLPADEVPGDEDIFDTMLVCKRKRGKDNVITKYKIRCVLCGNQMIKSAKGGQSKTTADMRTHAPAARTASLKMNFAVGVCNALRQRDFDVDAAYLQGRFVGQRVFARAPAIFRLYDERGVEYVWRLGGPLYGEPDAARLWYNTMAHYLMKVETVTPFNRCHFEPCGFYHVADEDVCLVDHNRVSASVLARKRETQDGAVAKPKYAKSAAGFGTRIHLLVYVDDGRTWDNCPTLCDGFYERLSTHFVITMDGGGLGYMLGMDIALGEGWARITSTTYIRGLCTKWLKHDISEYETVPTPGHPRLMELYEAAFVMRGDARDPKLAHDYHSLVGGLMWPAPSTRPDCLHTVGIHARALTFGTHDLFNTALRCLIYMGQTAEDGIMYTSSDPHARQLIAWTDSDWHVRRSTSGNTLQLAGGSVSAASRRQDCVTGSTTHAEIVAASFTSNDTVWARGYLEELGMEQVEPTPLMVDAQNVLTLVQNLITSKLTRHITRRELIVREREDAGVLVVTKCDTSDNLADIFTKVLEPPSFDKLRRLLMNLLRVGVSVARMLTPRKPR